MAIINKGVRGMVGRPGDLTLAQAARAFSYDPNTGVLSWRENHYRNKRGGVAGHIRETGYVRVDIYGHRYYAHRLIFLLILGRWPATLVDHINGDRADNRWENLREATRLQNRMNSVARRDSKCGLKGAQPYFRGVKAMWEARICVDGKRRYLGRFDTPEGAHKAYMSAARDALGDFAPDKLKRCGR